MSQNREMPLATSYHEELVEPDFNKFGLKEFAGLVLENWKLILVAIVFAWLIASVSLFLTPETYETDALVQVEQRTNAARVALTQVADAVDSESGLTTEMAILRSRLVLGEVVEARRLEIAANPTFWGGRIGEAFWRQHDPGQFASSPIPLSPWASAKFAWGGQSITVTTFEVPDELLGRTIKLRSLGEGEYQVLPPISPSPIAGRVGELLEIATEFGQVSIFVRRLVARPGNQFEVSRLPKQLAISRLRSRLRIGEAVKSSSPWDRTDLMRLRLSGTSRSEIAETLSQILTVYQEQNVDRRSAEAQKTLEFLEQQLPKLKSQVETAEARLNQFKVEQGTADLSQETALVLNLSVELEKRLRELTQEREEALKRYTENHPIVVSIDSQIAQVSDEIKEVSENVERLPSIQQEALRLTRDVEVSTALYVSLLNRAQELAVVKSGTVGNSRIVDSPIEPLTKIAPNKTKTMITALILGALSGLALSMLLYFLRDGIRDPEQLERRFGLPTYGAVPESKLQKGVMALLRRGGPSAEQSAILALSHPNAPAVESLRSVRTAMHFAQVPQEKSGLVAVMGPEPGVGKSFVCANLAAIAAASGSRVLLIDADMRKGYLGQAFGYTKDEAGLSELLSSQSTLKSVVRKTSISNLDLICAGQYPPNPSELLISNRLPAALEVLRERYDQVIIDTPPILLVTDASLIARYTGLNLLVLESGRHPLRAISDVLKNLQLSNVSIDGVVMNKVPVVSNAYGGYRYGYRYGYRATEYAGGGSEGGTSGFGRVFRRLFKS